MANPITRKAPKTVCHIAKSGGGEKFKSDSGRYTHFANSILESHRLYDKDSPKWGEFFTEFSSMNKTESIKSIDQALMERTKIIKSFNLARKVPKNSAYGFQLFLSASESFALDWRTSETDRTKWQDYFETCEKWVRKYFPGIVLSVAVHYDEKTPHMHVNLIPIRKNMPVFHNEKLKTEEGQYVMNQKGKIKTKKVMTLDKQGNPVLETKYTSGNFINPDELASLQTDFARAVERFGVERGEVDSRQKHEDLRKSTRINARKIYKEEVRLKGVEDGLNKEREMLERRSSLIQHLLSVPPGSFKIIEPEKKIVPGLYTWEIDGKKCKNFDEYRNKIIEDQVSKRVYQADLLVKKSERRIESLTAEVDNQATTNRILSAELAKLEKLLLEAPLADIAQYRTNSKTASVREVSRNNETSVSRGKSLHR